MKKNYKFGEMLLYLREEYMEASHILKELKNYILVNPESSTFYFDGYLSEEGNVIRLVVTKKYPQVLKYIQELRLDWYSQFLYLAYFNVNKDDYGRYVLEFDSISTPVNDNKRFVPSVKIVDQDKFDDLIDKLLALDIMNLSHEVFRINHDFISLDFSRVLISSRLGYKSLVTWYGNNDTIDYSIKKDCCPYLLESILDLEIPTDYILPDWLKLFEKHEKKFDSNIIFNVDLGNQKENGTLQINNQDHTKIKLLKK